jgi:tRNA (guanine-N7-)-methyltransferase
LKEVMRPIRSFVLRQGRISNAQQRAMDDLWPLWGVPFSPVARSFSAEETRAFFKSLFDRDAPVILEIGFGMGETTVAIAQAMPEKDFLAIDVHTPGIGSLLKQIAETGISNVRVMRHDAVEIVRDMLGPDTLDGIHIFFPDPWPKKRHHKRRLIQPEFVSLLASRLKPGGYLHLATDWEPYAHQMLEVLAGEPLLENSTADFAARPAYRPLTKFEQRGLRLGHGVWDLVFTKHLPVPASSA